MIETMKIELDEGSGLAGRLDRIREMAKEIELLPDETYAPQGSFLADVEWFSLAAVTKSTSNAHAFEMLVNARKTVAAAALVRMQIEAAMRLFGLTLVDDVDDAGTKLMHGEKYSALKLKNSKELLRCAFRKNGTVVPLSRGQLFHSWIRSVPSCLVEVICD